MNVRNRNSKVKNGSLFVRGFLNQVLDVDHNLESELVSWSDPIMITFWMVYVHLCNTRSFFSVV